MMSIVLDALYSAIDGVIANQRTIARRWFQDAI
jgi:hypothetical protein